MRREVMEEIGIEIDIIRHVGDFFSRRGEKFNRNAFFFVGQSQDCALILSRSLNLKY
ncbi:MAG: hypothetical protein JWM96_679 [Alphaproteobacteria bacterium]|nr:hypothetical protein [Alphaproteobacteria bacterium]